MVAKHMLLRLYVERRLQDGSVAIIFAAMTPKFVGSIPNLHPLLVCEKKCS